VDGPRLIYGLKMANWQLALSRWAVFYDKDGKNELSSNDCYLFLYTHPKNDLLESTKYVWLTYFVGF